jgi:uncharacterized repeat protein (TIGR03803 family)
MTPVKPKLTRFRTMGAVAFLSAASVLASPAQTFTNLVSFNGSNGNNPLYMTLVDGADGNFYGATYNGGGKPACPDCGTVFKVTPAGSLTTLYSFGGPDGANPAAGLIRAGDGNFYGTTVAGGTDGGGTIFRITPAGVLTTLYSFPAASGVFGNSPYAPLIQAADGNFYGTTLSGGAYGDGTVFRMTPDGVVTTLHSFNLADGAFPFAALLQAADGNFYGTTSAGPVSYSGGTIFKITSGGVFTSLYSFGSNDDGELPFGGLVQASDGNFYGTTSSGGLLEGTVFQMTPAGEVTTLYDFLYAAPSAGLIQATDGNLYGTTSDGGGDGGYQQSGSGTIFKITPAGALTVLHSFTGSDGLAPSGGLLQAGNGLLYGTASTGGAGTACLGGCGVVFSLDAGLTPQTPHEDLIWQNTTTLQTNVNYYSGSGPQAQGSAVLNNNSGLNGWNVVGAADFDRNGVPDLVWQNTATGEVTVNYYGGSLATSIIGSAVLNSGAGAAGWSVVAVADMNGDGSPDLIWQNQSTGQVNVNYYGGAGGAALTGFAVLNNGGGTAGWKVVAAADFDGNGTPDLVWQNTSTAQVNVNYYGGSGGAALIGWAVLDSGAAMTGWTVQGAADMNADEVPDLIWENPASGQAMVNYYGGTGGAVFKGSNCLNCGANSAGLTVRAVADFNANGQPDLVWQNNTTSQVTVSYYGLGGAVFSGSNVLNSGAQAGGWKLVAAADFDANGFPDLVWRDSSTGQVNVNYYGGPGGATLTGYAVLNSGAGTAGWSVVAAADCNGDGVPDLVWQNQSTGQVNVNYYGGPGGATLTGYAVLNSGAGTQGWKVVAAADFDGNGAADLVWQNLATGQVNVNYYTGPQLTGYAVLNSGAGTAGWSVVGAGDFDGNGVPDLVWQETSTGQLTVNYYGGPNGAVFMGWNWLNMAQTPGWLVIPARSQ